MLVIGQLAVSIVLLSASLLFVRNLVQASTNLADWFTIGTNVLSTNTTRFTDHEATNFTQRAYRVLQLP